MPLPKMIEVVPFTKQQLAAFKSTKAEIVIPGSKSITNRAIVLAAMSEGTVTLNGALWSEDTEAMSDCMQKLGIKTVVEPDPKVAANRIITVTGCGGKIPLGGTEEAPLELFVANAGTAARFLTAMVCLGEVGFVYRLSGVPRMHERPQKELIRALRALGCTHRPPRHLHIIIWRPNLVALIPLGSRAYSCLLLRQLAAGPAAGLATRSLCPHCPLFLLLLQLGRLLGWPLAPFALAALTRRPQPPPSLTALRSRTPLALQTASTLPTTSSPPSSTAEDPSLGPLWSQSTTPHSLRRRSCSRRAAEAGRCPPLRGPTRTSCPMSR